MTAGDDRRRGPPELPAALDELIANVDRQIVASSGPPLVLTPHPRTRHVHTQGMCRNSDMFVVSEFARMRANMGPTASKFGPNRPNLPGFGPEVVSTKFGPSRLFAFEVGQTWAVKCGPISTNIRRSWPESANFGQHRPTSPKSLQTSSLKRPNLNGVDRIWDELGISWPEIGQSRAEIGRMWSECVEVWLNWRGCWPTLSRM